MSGIFPAGPGPRGARAAPGAVCPVCLAPLGRPPGHGGPAPRPRERGFCSRCRTPYSFTPPLRAGDVVAQWRVVAGLAAGGPGPAGWVFLAVDTGSTGGAPGRRVVLKSLRRTAPHAMFPATSRPAAHSASHLTAHPATRPASHPMTHLMSRPAPRSGAAVPRRSPPPAPDPPLRHPAIVRTLGEVRHAGLLYAVMEFVAGPSLAELLRTRRRALGVPRAPLPVSEAIAGTLGLLSALRYVHERGYVFCDLAPANVVWNAGRVTLVDLQSLRPIGRRNGAFPVTAGFDAPELTVSPPSVGSDLYALGRLLATAVLDFPHRASAYRYTLPAQEVDKVLARHEPLRRFLLRATAADPADRFTGAGEMAAALTEIAAGTGGGPAGIAPSAAPGGVGALFTRQIPGRPGKVAEHGWAAGVPQTGLPAAHPGRSAVDSDEGTEITGVDARGGSCHYSSRRPWI